MRVGVPWETSRPRCVASRRRASVNGARGGLRGLRRQRRRHVDLRRIAHGQRARWRGQATLETTALLHEAWLKVAREKGVLTSLDGGGLRANTEELLGYIDVAVVAERLCEQMNLSEEGMLDYLKSRGCKIGGVTSGEKGMLWYDEQGVVQRLKSLPVPPEKVIDTSGAGDIFHGAYVASYVERLDAPWVDHFRFARAASAHKIQHLGNEAGLPTQADIEKAQADYPVAG